jgi:lipopolysaccharide cholinephosphotransferase
MTVFLNPANDSHLQQTLREAQLKMLNMLKVVDTLCLKHQLDYWLDGGTLLGAIRHQGFIPWDDDLDISMPRASFEAFLQVAANELPSSMRLQTAKLAPGYFNLAVPLKIRDQHSRCIEWHEEGNEPYQQGIFIDVFAVDKLPKSLLKRRFYKIMAKKVLRLLHAKSSPLNVGHHANVYRCLAPFVPKATLEHALQWIIRCANQETSFYLGCGYDSVNSNQVEESAIYPLRRGLFEGSLFNLPQRAEVILTGLYGDYLTLPPEHQRVMKHCKELVP